MTSPDLLERLCEWIEASYHQSGTILDLHCSRVFKSVPLPDGAAVSVVSVRHQTPRAAGAPDLFVVELWNVCRAPVQQVDVKEMCLALATFRAWYSEILEEAEIEGLRRRHRFSVHGNLVGPSVDAAAMIDLLSHHGGEVAFWIYRESAGRAEFDPHYGEGPRASRSALVQILDHLAWEGPADPAGSASAGFGRGSI
jgi:hypothetical protein